MIESARETSRRRRKRTVFVVWIAVVATLLTAAFFVYIHLTTRVTPLSQPVFDRHACVRMADVTRVYAIRNDPQHAERLWFATAQGVRVLDVDALEWRRYGLDHDLPSEDVHDICFSDGVPWVATAAGVARLDTGRERFVSVPVGPDRQAANALAIAAVAGHGVFVSLDSLGVRHIAPGDSMGRPLDLPGLARGAPITCLRASDDGLYVGGAGRTVLCYRPGDAHVRALTFAGNRPSRNTVVWDIARMSGELWAATSDDGIWRQTAGSDSLREVQSCPAKGAFIFAGETDGFWCGTPYGLWRYYRDGDVWMQFVNPDEKKPTDFQVFALAVTPTTLWYGSMESGAGFFRKEQVKWQKMRAGLSAPNVAALASTDGSLWTAYGYRGEMLDRFSADGLQYQGNYGSRDGIADPNIQTLQACDGRVYYGGYRSFGVIDRGRLPAHHYQEGERLPCGDIAAILCCGSTRYLAGQFGVVAYREASDSFAVVPTTQSRRATSLLLLGDSLWYGTLSRGVRLVDLRSSREAGAFLDGTMRVTGLAEVSVGGRGTVFVATKRDGCALVDRQTMRLAKLALPLKMLGALEKGEGEIVAMRCMDGRVWLGTRAGGCLIYDPRDARWRVFAWHEGLVTNQVRSFCDDARYVWIGCYGGITRLDKTYLNTTLFGRPRSGS